MNLDLPAYCVSNNNKFNIGSNLKAAAQALFQHQGENNFHLQVSVSIVKYSQFRFPLFKISTSNKDKHLLQALVLI